MLHAQAELLFQRKLSRDALVIAEEASERYRRLVQSSPCAFTLDLSRLLTTLSEIQAETGANEAAFQTASVSVQNLSSLVHSSPEVAPYLARALLVRARRYEEVSRTRDAFESATQGLEVLLPYFTMNIVKHSRLAIDLLKLDLELAERLRVPRTGTLRSSYGAILDAWSALMTDLAMLAQEAVKLVHLAAPGVEKAALTSLASSFLTWLKARFFGTPAQVVLEQALNKPNDNTKQRLLEESIIAAAGRDENFRRQLAEFVIKANVISQSTQTTAASEGSKVAQVSGNQNSVKIG